MTDIAQYGCELRHLCDAEHRDLKGAWGALADAGSVVTDPVELGIRQLVAERDALVGASDILETRLRDLVKTWRELANALDENFRRLPGGEQLPVGPLTSAWVTGEALCKETRARADELEVLLNGIP